MVGKSDLDNTFGLVVRFSVFVVMWMVVPLSGIIISRQLLPSSAFARPNGSTLPAHAGPITSHSVFVRSGAIEVTLITDSAHIFG